jgi:hypothetical protein
MPRGRVSKTGRKANSCRLYGRIHESSCKIVNDPAHIHDFNATALHLSGLEHTRQTYRLEDIHGEVGRGVLA